MDYNFYTNIIEGKENKGPVIGDPSFFQTKEETRKWLDEKRIKGYVINDDLTIDINTHLQLSYINKNIPVKFGKVNGSMSISDCLIDTLKGCPDEVNGDFSCCNNSITTLEHCPIFKGSFYCKGNELISLKGCQKVINGQFDCSENKLTSLKYGPEKVSEDFYCNDNKITSLKDLPLVEGKHIFIHNNPVKTLKGLKNVNLETLVSLLDSFPKLDWKEIAWDKVKDIDKLVDKLYENIDKRTDYDVSKKILKLFQEASAY